MFRILYKNSSVNLIFYISGISVLLTLFFWLFTYEYITKPFAYIIVVEAIIICFLMIIRIGRMRISARLFRQKSMIQKALLNEFFESALLIQYGLTLHIFCILIYRQFPISDEVTPILDLVIYIGLPLFTIWVVGVSSY